MIMMIRQQQQKQKNQQIIKHNKIRPLMENLTPQQLDTALRLCDLLGLEDFTIATAILQQVDWSLQKAIDMMQEDQTKKQVPQKKQEQAAPVPHYYDQPNESQQQDYQHFQYEYENINDLQNKKRQFQQGFQGVKLDRSISQPPTQMQRRLSYDRRILQNFADYRHTYQVKLLQDSEKFYQKILNKNSQQNKRVYRSRIRNNQNRRFICQLDQKYHTKINFTFGTFMLNLVRSYLDKKYLLVYIHQSKFEDSSAIKMILTQKEIANFINKNCVSYGMFDNSDDYDILQKYIPLKDIPAFGLFKYSRKTRKQKFISAYSVLQKQPSSFIQWISTSIGVPLKKKSQITGEVKKENQGKQKQKQKSKQFAYTHTDIMKSQNQQYEEMERIWKLKRQQSKLKKQQIAHAEQMIVKMKQKFKQQPKFQQGKTIQIKFRMPQSGKSIMRVFALESKIKQMFEFVSCFGRDQFQSRYGKFDLTQTFPNLSLENMQQKTIKQVFEGSSHENIIVKQL